MARRAARLASLLALVGAALVTAPPVASGAAATPSRCTGAQLAIARGRGMGAAGHVGTTFVIANVSTHACTLEGFARLHLTTQAPAPKPIVVTDDVNGDFMYAKYPVRLVTLTRTRAATFGVNRTDAYNQSQSNLTNPGCQVQTVTITLPIAGTATPYTLGFKFNVCFSNYRVGVTPIEGRASPKVR